MRFFCQLSRQHPLQSHDQPPNLFMFVSFLKPRSCLAIFWKCSLCHHNCITNPSNPANQQQTGSPNKQCQPLAVSFWRFITNKKQLTSQRETKSFIWEPTSTKPYCHFPTEVPYTIRGRAEVMARYWWVPLHKRSAVPMCVNGSQVPPSLWASGETSVPFGDLSLLFLQVLWLDSVILKNCKPNKFRRVLVVGSPWRWEALQTAKLFMRNYSWNQ